MCNNYTKVDNFIRKCSLYTRCNKIVRVVHLLWWRARILRGIQNGIEYYQKKVTGSLGVRRIKASRNWHLWLLCTTCWIFRKVNGIFSLSSNESKSGAPHCDAPSNPFALLLSNQPPRRRWYRMKMKITRTRSGFIDPRSLESNPAYIYLRGPPVLNR